MRQLAALALALTFPYAALHAASPRAPRAPLAPLAPFEHAPVAAEEIIGRWDLTVIAADKRTYPSWFEVKLSGFRTLVGSFVSGGGSARPVARVIVNGTSFRFTIPPQWEQGDGEMVIEGTVAGGKLSGTITEPNGGTATFTGVRAPTLERAAPARWGSPIAIFNGRDLSGWKPSGSNTKWQVINGILTNTGSGANLITDATFTDFKLHVEFRVPKSGNSGIYLRGRHEVQVEDSKGLEPGSTHTGGVYGFLTPNENAAGEAGTWQTYDITLVGRLITVVLNGKTVISMQNIPGITGGALDSDEGAPGPIYLQGDHTAVEYRKITLTPAK